jgi:nucleoside-diphosphate-sugar epimerase
VFKPSREGDVHDSQADIFKARQILDFEPTTSFDDGLRKTVDWYQRAHAAAGSRT